MLKTTLSFLIRKRQPLNFREASLEDFGVSKERDLIYRHGQVMERWESKPNPKQQKSVFTTRKWNDSKGKYEYFHDTRPWKDLPEREQQWHKHTNSKRYRLWKRQGHDQIMKETNRIRDKRREVYGTIQHGVFKNSKYSKLLSTDQKLQLLSMAQDNPDVTELELAGKFRIPVDAVQYYWKSRVFKNFGQKRTEINFLDFFSFES